MADIKQAARWIMQGREVRRYIWGSRSRMWLNMDKITVMVGDGPGTYHPYELPVVDLIAEDWEIAR